MKDIQLYDYQRMMLRRIEKELDEPSGRVLHFSKTERVRLGKSVLVQMPTGTGKTFVMAAVIRSVKVDGSVWVIAHRRELVDQMKETLSRFGIAYKESKGKEDWGKTKVRVMSVQWLARNIGWVKEKAHPGLLVIDEAHHAIATTYQNLWSVFPEALKIGFTATPCRLKATSFSKLFDALLTSWSIRRFIEIGRLSLYDYVVINKDSEDQRMIDSLEKRDASGDYSTTEMDHKLNVDPAIIRLYQSVNKFAHGKKGIVYAISIKHARHIAGYYTRQGLKAVALDSKTPAAQRAQVVEDFKHGRIDCLVNVNLFDEGFDCPDVEYIQLARPTLSLSKYLQMVGRGLRVHPNKTMCVLIDNVGLYRMFGLPDAERDWKWTFNGNGAGRGRLDRTRNKNLRIVNNDMEIIVSHSHAAPKTADEEREFVAHVEPYENGGRWGLRSGEEIVLQPTYKNIEPFVGNYGAYSIADGRWGVLTRLGRVVVSPDYKGVQVLPDNIAVLRINDFVTKDVDLKAAEREEESQRENRKRWIKSMEEWKRKHTVAKKARQKNRTV